LKTIFNFNAMLICLCKSVSDRDLARAIASGASSVEEVGRCTGAGTGCGACREAIGCAVAHARSAGPCSERSQLIALRTLAAVVG
jgi:bacterioferritin-associated ferredoxin